MKYKVPRKFEFPMTQSMIENSVPQEFESYGPFFGPLGLFLFGFVRLERKLSWSFASSFSDVRSGDTKKLLAKASKFEGTNKEASTRISLWFKAYREMAGNNGLLPELNAVKSDLLSLNHDRNRLCHDSSGLIIWTSYSGSNFAPSYVLSKSTKSGEMMKYTYTLDALREMLLQTLTLREELSNITLKLFPDAPRSEI